MGRDVDLYAPIDTPLPRPARGSQVRRGGQVVKIKRRLDPRDAAATGDSPVTS